MFKIKEHLPNPNKETLESIIESFYSNTVCQALYLQNIPNAFLDAQLDKLIALLRKKHIWCLNLGENNGVTLEGWIKFCDQLPSTSVTHLYVSENIISPQLKIEMRQHVRENRKKHELHNSPVNLRIIKQCTHCWWNPMQSKAIKEYLNEKRVLWLGMVDKDQKDPIPIPGQEYRDMNFICLQNRQVSSLIQLDKRENNWDKS